MGNRYTTTMSPHLKPNLTPLKTTPSQNQSFTLILSHGSITSFNYPSNPSSSAIVNAANESCLGGGGVDGAISDAGGRTLFEDRLALPIIVECDDAAGRRISDGAAIRCPTGSAVITGPGAYGTLHVPYVIHAVGPNYMTCHDQSQEQSCDELLKECYRSSLERGKERRLECVAFSLISSGVFSGGRDKREILRMGVEVVREFEGYGELKEVHFCAFTRREVDLMIGIIEEMER